MKNKIATMVRQCFLIHLDNKFYACTGNTICVTAHDKMEIVSHIEETDGPYIAVTTKDRYPLGLGFDFDIYQKVTKNIINLRLDSSLI